MRLAQLALASTLVIAVAAPAMAGVSSPEDRALKKVLVGAVTSCEAPLVISGTRSSLGGEAGLCADAGVETLTLRGEPVHVRLVEDDALKAYGPLACRKLYKYSPPGVTTTYNLNSTGTYSFHTSTVCISEESLSLDKPEVTTTRRGASESVRTAPPTATVR